MMLRLLTKAVVSVPKNILTPKIFKNVPKITILPTNPYHSFAKPFIPQLNLLQNPEIINISQTIRPLTKFSLQKGKRKSVKAVLKRFYRLDWGGWIRTKAGRHKKLWKKSESRKRRLRQHVFTNASQSWLLDKMVTKFWRKRKYYVEDPYEPYHNREEFSITRKKPV